MPRLKCVISAVLFCTAIVFCAASANADTTYTYTGAQFVEGAIGCPPECNFTGSFTLATPIPPNANAAINTFSFSLGPLTFTSLSNGPFGVSTNAAGAIDNWAIDMIDMLDAGGDIAEFVGGPDGDQIFFGSPNPPNGLKFFGAADSFGAIPGGFWTASTSTGVPEPASGTLLISGLVGLAGLALKKSL
ncbi:MAG TPA: hypothetical protein VE545_06010 [Candidatus Dormibacteraeota bacterium]|nr:hypothetical protein [Candidatus Dormibacteraeota bacterium]